MPAYTRAGHDSAAAGAELTGSLESDGEGSDVVAAARDELLGLLPAEVGPHPVQASVSAIRAASHVLVMWYR
jgi:hypothetical protein